MESQVTSFRGHRGFLLITVLIVTAVGLLFGAGALLLFRFQCQQRIDRQHELEKIYAVRSALSYIRTSANEVSVNGQPFRYRTCSGRNLGVVVKPVAPLFPVDSEKHFFMEKGHFIVDQKGVGGYDPSRDYEYGVSGMTNIVMSREDPGSPNTYGLAFTDLTVTNVKCWVNIGMRETGSWLQEDYGRRYYFYLKNCVGGVSEGQGAMADKRDLIRLCIIRDVTNVDGAHPVGRQHGWPLSREGERALVFQSPESDSSAVMKLYEYWYEGGVVRQRLLVQMSNCAQTFYNMGLQIADDKVSVFFRENPTKNNGTTGYTFSTVTNMWPETYAYFAQGALKNDEGKIIQAPELRAVIEVEASSNLRPASGSYYDFLTDFRVTPAYQYDIFLEHPISITNRATVAQRMGTSARGGTASTIITYDTHGTENKGFRKDEREAERKRNGQ